jgi:hypothetical protein
MQEAWHAGDLPECICTDLRLTVRLRYDMWNVPDINLSESSLARAFQSSCSGRLISVQVRLTEVGQHGMQSRQYPVCAMISGGCLFFLYFGPVELVYSTFAKKFCPSSCSKCVCGQNQCCDEVVAATRFYVSQVLCCAKYVSQVLCAEI